MDNSNSNPGPVTQPPMPEAPAAQAIPTVPPAVPPVSASQPTTDPAQAPKNGNNKLWLIVGMIIVILMLGAAYWFIVQTQPESETVPEETTQDQTPTTVSAEALEAETSSIEVEEIEAQFSEVDTDLKGL